MEEFDVIVVGGGPGGSVCVSYLGKKGYRTLLLERAKFPRDKTCGDAVGGKCVKIARELGLLPVLESEKPHANIDGALFSSPKGDVVTLPFPNPKDTDQKSPGYVCRREVFDDMLLQNAKSYAAVIEEFNVTDVIVENNFVVGVKGMHVPTKEQREYRAKVVVGADGAYSVVAKKMGLGELDDSHTCMALRAYYEGIEGLTPNIELHFVDSLIPGYFWIFPIEDGKANVGIGMVNADLKKRKMKLTESMMDIINNNPLFKERFKNAKMVGRIEGWALPMASKQRKMYGNGFLLVGDAAALIDPFSGEGVGNAMTAGKIAADVIDRAFEQNDFSEKTMKEHQEETWKELGPELRNSYRLQRIGRIKLLLNFVIHRAATRPKVREALIGMLADEEARKEFANPLFYAKMLLA